jgi:hypothetical protein
MKNKISGLKELRVFKEMRSKISNKNLMIHNMKKPILRNVQYLQGLARNSKEKVMDKISHIIELYKERKIPNITTVQNLILSLRSPNQGMVNKALRQYASLAEKYQDAEPLPEKHLRLRKAKTEVKVAQNKASSKITKMLRTSLTIKITKKETALGDNVVDYTVQFGYIGTVIKYDMTAIMYRAFNLVKKALESKRKFKFYSNIRLWSNKSNYWKDNVFSGDFNSNDINLWLHHFAQQIQNVVQSDDQISLKQSVLKFHFVFQPEGAGVGTDDRSKDSIMNKKGVNTIINDDKNCFWYALSVSMNPKNAVMKDNRGPQKARKAFGLSLCQKAKLQWDEPVSFEHIPLVEEALNINIYIIDMENIPVLGSAINIWDALMYRNENKKNWETLVTL